MALIPSTAQRFIQQSNGQWFDRLDERVVPFQFVQAAMSGYFQSRGQQVPQQFQISPEQQTQIIQRYESGQPIVSQEEQLFFQQQQAEQQQQSAIQSQINNVQQQLADSRQAYASSSNPDEKMRYGQQMENFTTRLAMLRDQLAGISGGTYVAAQVTGTSGGAVQSFSPQEIEQINQQLAAYSQHPEQFTKEEINLLAKSASDISGKDVTLTYPMKETQQTTTVYIYPVWKNTLTGQKASSQYAPKGFGWELTYETSMGEPIKLTPQQQMEVKAQQIIAQTPFYEVKEYETPEVHLKDILPPSFNPLMPVYTPAKYGVFDFLYSKYERFDKSVGSSKVGQKVNYFFNENPVGQYLAPTVKLVGTAVPDPVTFTKLMFFEPALPTTYQSALDIGLIEPKPKGVKVTYQPSRTISETNELIFPSGVRTGGRKDIQAIDVYIGGKHVENIRLKAETGFVSAVHPSGKVARQEVTEIDFITPSTKQKIKAGVPPTIEMSGGKAGKAVSQLKAVDQEATATFGGIIKDYTIKRKFLSSEENLILSPEATFAKKNVAARAEPAPRIISETLGEETPEFIVRYFTKDIPTKAKTYIKIKHPSEITGKQAADLFFSPTRLGRARAKIPFSEERPLGGLYSEGLDIVPTSPKVVTKKSYELGFGFETSVRPKRTSASEKMAKEAEDIIDLFTQPGKKTKMAKKTVKENLDYISEVLSESKQKGTKQVQVQKIKQQPYMGIESAFGGTRDLIRKSYKTTAKQQAKQLGQDLITGGKVTTQSGLGLISGNIQTGQIRISQSQSPVNRNIQIEMTKPSQQEKQVQKSLQAQQPIQDLFTGEIQRSAQIQKSQQVQKQVQKQVQAQRMQTASSLLTPTITTPKIRTPIIPPPILPFPKLNIEEDMFGLHKPKSRKYKYTPTLGGILSGKKIKKEPKSSTLFFGSEERRPTSKEALNISSVFGITNRRRKKKR